MGLVTCWVQGQNYRSQETFSKVRFQGKEGPHKGQESEQELRMQGQSLLVRIRAHGWGWDFRMGLEPSY